MLCHAFLLKLKNYKLFRFKRRFDGAVFKAERRFINLHMYLIGIEFDHADYRFSMLLLQFTIVDPLPETVSKIKNKAKFQLKVSGSVIFLMKLARQYKTVFIH